MPKNNRGFTLIEMLAVIAIVGLLATVIIPRYHQSLALQRLRVVADELQGDIRFAQQLAISEGLNCEIHFFRNSDPPAYDIYQRYTRMARKSLPPGITIEAVGFTQINYLPTLRFSFDGVPSSGGTVTLANQYGARTRVITTPVTGRVRILEE